MDRNDRQAIDDLFGKLAAVEENSPQRDSASEALIREHIARQPSAPYYMAQTIVVQNQALAAAEARIAALEGRDGAETRRSGSVPTVGRGASADLTQGMWRAGAHQAVAGSSPERRRRRSAWPAASCSATPSPACLAAAKPRQPRRSLKPKSRQPQEPQTEEPETEGAGIRRRRIRRRRIRRRRLRRLLDFGSAALVGLLVTRIGRDVVGRRARDGVASAEPAGKIDVGATLRAERAVGFSLRTRCR